MSKRKSIPFFGPGAIPYDEFCGRDDLRRVFSDSISPENLEEKENFVWVIEGKRGFGKSSFGKWCEAEAYLGTGEQDPDIAVCYIDFSEKIDPNVAVTSEKLIHLLYNELAAIDVVKHYDPKGRKLKASINLWFAGSEYEPGDPRPDNIGDFFKRLGVAAESFPRIGAFIFIFDDITSRQGVESLSSDFAAAVARRTWQTHLPTIGLILLPHPGFEDRMPPALKPTRHISKKYELKEFDPAETRDLVERLCRGTPWTPNSSFINELHLMSGGIPDLIQRIGQGSCRASKRRDAQSHTLTQEDVRTAVAVDDSVARSIESVITTSGFIMPKKGSHEQQVLAAFCDSFKSSEAASGLLKDRWQDTILKKFNQSEIYAKTFMSIWKDLCETQLLTHDENTSKYKFIAEAVRQYFSR
jgi:hypothetical protein